MQRLPSQVSSFPARYGPCWILFRLRSPQVDALHDDQGNKVRNNRIRDVTDQLAAMFAIRRCPSYRSRRDPRAIRVQEILDGELPS